ncbi:ABC transporter substrate-binding protein [Deinococcus gobiensis]|uniref:ABC-type Fe3+-siderophore transport system, periplasmic component n=1 Tax=Deinococcus gobiensis (strain DSM 21396 / JCM 16679 / CGMCC 1.7299 / I-0) TaxID=745776 RepID=H8H0T9_DEIGI|nr:ABC transporter substrate-binding protein [Deinococcus gobiensis]AFD26958.1 ABC-type Fe3+-siderophore transport system, periplasmic component [Deinococcus gobiensis I-0]
MHRRSLTPLLLAALLGIPAWAAPVTVGHGRGTLTLPAPATRVAALEYSFVDTLLALGVRPVGAALGTQGGDRGAPPYLQAQVRGIAATGSRAQPSLEALAAVRPDVILADEFVHKDLYPQLTRLVPTTAFQSRRGDLADLNAQTLAIGRLVGREAAARRLLADQASLNAKARAFARKGAPAFVAAVVTPGSFTVHSDQSFVGSFLEALGRKNQLAPKGGQSQYDLSLEGLVALNPASLVLFTAPDEVPLTETWKKSPLWPRLSAVQRGRVYVFNRDNWTRGRGPQALKLMVAETIRSRFLQDAAPATGFGTP